jgi:hypothetical protein
VHLELGAGFSSKVLRIEPRIKLIRRVGNSNEPRKQISQPGATR